MDKSYVNLFGVLETAGKDLANSKHRSTDLRDYLGKPMSILRRQTDADVVEVYQGRTRLRFLSDANGLIRHASVHDPGIRPATSEELKEVVPDFLGSHGIAASSLKLVLDDIPGRLHIENMAGIPEGFSAKIESRADGIHLFIERPS